MMVKVGIDTMAVYTPRYALNLTTLAKKRGIDPDKFHIGLGQSLMSVPPPGEDIVTMACNAAHVMLQDIPRDDIELLLFATESGIDQSKAAGLYVHELLDLPSRCRVIEVKQACYSATAALQLSLSFLRDHPTKKVLLIASDIARYGLSTPGESSQGAGAVAMLLTVNPRLLAIDPHYGVASENVMDFWRPNYRNEALVEGKYSSKLYLAMLEKAWRDYQMRSQHQFKDHAYFCYHVPVPRLVEKAHLYLAKLNASDHLPLDVLMSQVNASLQYGRQIGNSYTASLYVGLASLLDLSSANLAEQRIGFYSYGSGCVAEYFSGIVEPHYRNAIHSVYHQALLSHRTLLTYDQYEQFFAFHYVEDGSEQTIPVYDTGIFRLTKMQQHKRIYEIVAPRALITDVNNKTQTALAQGMT